MMKEQQVQEVSGTPFIYFGQHTVSRLHQLSRDQQAGLGVMQSLTAAFKAMIQSSESFSLEQKLLAIRNIPRFAPLFPELAADIVAAFSDLCRVPPTVRLHDGNRVSRGAISRMITINASISR